MFAQEAFFIPMEKDIQYIYDLFLSAKGVSIDTRTLEPGDLFFALRGPSFNGNAYVSKALDQGASFVVMDDPEYYVADSKMILVKNAEQCLQDLAKHHRCELDIPILAITGSNGKTTTKELCLQVLSSTYRVGCTQGNLNNHLGVPLTLLSFDKDTEVGIVEMGANHQYEIDFLCKIAIPTVGLITNVGRAHIGEFGSAEIIYQSKSELYRYLIEHQGSIIINDSNVRLLQDFKDNVSMIASLDTSQGTIQFIKTEPSIVLEWSHANGNSKQFDVNLGGKHNVENVKVAIAVGLYFDLSMDQVLEALASFNPPANRSQWISTKDNQVFLDAYNANPSSMEMAIKYFQELDGDKVLILGEMMELGQFEREEHALLFKRLKVGDIPFYLIGEAFKEIQDHRIFPSRAAFEQYLKTQPIRSKKILLKASRGMKLESLLQYL